ncbi:MAG: molybdopterin dinucleotide binding domain-containing protein [Methylotenera sp.]
MVCSLRELVPSHASPASGCRNRLPPKSPPFGTVEQIAALGVNEGDAVLVKQDKGSAVLQVRLDNHVAMGCVRVTASHEASTGLGDLMGDITVEKYTETSPFISKAVSK